MKRIMYGDFDTLLYAAASQQQKNTCISINKNNGESKEWESKTKFNEWLVTQKAYNKEDFDFEIKSILVGEPRFAFQSIKQKVDKIFNASYCDDYYVCIQGSGNFRNDYVTPHVEYKGHRAAKPILFQECFDYTVRKYGNRCIVSTGIETDDFVCQKGYESYNMGLSQKDKSKCPYVIAFCDKDIKSGTAGWLLNYNKLEDGVFWHSELSRAKCFWTQMLMGDKADNIVGVGTVTENIKKKYGLKGNNGCGTVSASKILDGELTEKEMAERVIEVYQNSHPDTWDTRMQDVGFFLYMTRFEGDRFNLEKYLEGLK